MINRTYIRCSECGHEMMVRTAIGHGRSQKFAFPCKGCGAEISFEMILDQERGSFEYLHLNNGQWFNYESELGDIIVLDEETLVPNDIGNFFSPFMRTSRLPENVELFHGDRELRLIICNQLWPILQKCKIYCDNSNWKLYEQSVKRFDSSFRLGSVNRNIAHFLRTIHRVGEPFRPFTDDKSRFIRDRINAIEENNEVECGKLRDYLRSIGWVNSLYVELFSIKDKWATCVYYILQPLYLVLYWNKCENSLSNYYISQKRFSELKQFYVDVYETFCRVSVVAMGLEGIGLSGRLCVKDGVSSVDIDEFRGMDNGRKRKLIESSALACFFNSICNNQMRNGVGHHSAHYRVDDDSVVYRIENKRSVRECVVSYNNFCWSLFEMYYNFELVSVYLHWLFARERGLTGRVV